MAKHGQFVLDRFRKGLPMLFSVGRASALASGNFIQIQRKPTGQRGGGMIASEGSHQRRPGEKLAEVIEALGQRGNVPFWSLWMYSGLGVSLQHRSALRRGLSE
jgi:hypothetical protein